MFFSFTLFFLFSLVVARQQCRLQERNNQVVIHEPVIPSADPGGESSPSAATPTRTSSSTPAPTYTPFNYGSQKIRGVNLGGWLVLEPWITPSIFENTGDDDIIDEYTFGQLQDEDTALSVLENHWDTWIIEQDFIDIKAAGLTHVRIPLGYWSVPLASSDTNQSTSPSPYIPGAWPYLLRGLNWARTHNVHVIIDIHGAPGSQNGYDNSGQRRNDPQWAANPNYVQRTVDTVRFVAAQVGGMIDVLELLNEPAGFYGDDFTSVVRQFWLDGYDAVREAAGDEIKVMIGDAFRGVDIWTNFMTYPDAQGVLMDYHQYQIFSNSELSRSFDDHVSHACSILPNLRSFSNNNIWTVMGEWSNAATDCAKWLNGRGIGARWDGTRQQPDSLFFDECDGWSGSYSNFSDSYKTFLSRYFQAQIEVGEAIQGWVYWTWKAENADEWSYQKGLEGGWIPQDPTDRQHPDICS